MTGNNHPIALLLANADKLGRWVAGTDPETPTVAVGALGEIVASMATGVPIVSDRIWSHDLAGGERRIEVKTRTNGARVGDLSGKECEEVARVDLCRRPDGRGGFELWLEGVRLRPHPAPPGRDAWMPIASIEPRRLL